MKSRYEEKTYESYFNNELDKKSKIYFPPGQVLEGNLGFDASSFSTSRLLWHRLGYPFFWRLPFSGVDLIDIAKFLEADLEDEIDNIPKMKANILFQYKRPEFITSKLGKEWKHWHKPYYRYDIYQDQQMILEKIHNEFKSKVLVIYASPCSHDVNELVSIRKKLIKNSNFAKAIDLKGHHRNTYIKSGNHSIACSEPERVNSINIVEELNHLSDEPSQEFHSNSEFILEFSKEIQNVVTEDQYIYKSFYELNEDIKQLEQYKLLHSLLVMNNFRALTGTQWLIKL
ncbi:hypothetical protein [Vibrio harveyi]